MYIPYINYYKDYMLNPLNLLCKTRQLRQLKSHD